MFEIGTYENETPTLFTEAETGRTYYNEWGWISTRSGGYEGKIRVYLDDALELAS